METLSKNILSTIIYYDILDYPLTSFEIWKHLIANGEKTQEKDSLFDVSRALEDHKIKKYTEEHHGFYFLKGRKDLVSRRIERNKISEKKFRIIKKVVFWLRFCPFLKMAAVTGRVAMKNAGKESDLDFLVVLKKKRIFTGRLLVTFFVHLLGKRRYGKKITDRVCLNYYLSKKNLKIRTEDLFSAHEYSFITPVFGGKTFQKFQKANDWIGNFKPNWRPDSLLGLKIMEDSDAAKFARKWGERILGWDFLEEKLKKWQKKRIEKDPRTKKTGSLIVADDEALVFLPEPQGPQVYSRFKKRLELLTLP